jgi:hypothetical protein
MKNILVTIGVLLIFNNSKAQNLISINMNNAKPKKDFAKNISNKPIGGFSISYLHQLKNIKNLSIGGHAGVMMYGNRTYSANIIDRQGVAQQTDIFEDDCYTSIGAQARYTFLHKHLFLPYAIFSISKQSFFSHADPVDKSIDFPTQFQWQGKSAVIAAGFGFRSNLIKQLVKKPLKALPSLDINNTYNIGTSTTYRNFDNMLDKQRVSLNEAKNKSAILFSNISVALVWSW